MAADTPDGSLTSLLDMMIGKDYTRLEAQRSPGPSASFHANTGAVGSFASLMESTLAIDALMAEPLEASPKRLKKTARAQQQLSRAVAEAPTETADNDIDRTMSTYPWYVGACDVTEATDLLHGCDVGTALLRRVADTFTLTVVGPNNLSQHFPIRLEGGKFDIRDGMFFSSLPDLYGFYVQSSTVFGRQVWGDPNILFTAFYPDDDEDDV